MSKKYIAVLLFILILIPFGSVYASDTSSIGQFSVTSGIELGQTESTFDKTRTITGSSETGSLVFITLSKKNTSGTFNEYARYSIDIGPTGLFSQTVELELGESVVSVIAKKNDKIINSGECTIKRKKREIKTELETGVSIPGITNIIGIY